MLSEKQFRFPINIIILPFSSSYIRTRNSLRLQMIYVPSFFLGFNFGITNKEG